MAVCNSAKAGAAALLSLLALLWLRSLIWRDRFLPLPSGSFLRFIRRASGAARVIVKPNKSSYSNSSHN